MFSEEKQFYEQQYESDHYAKGIDGRVEKTALEKFINSYNLKNKKVLEIGCGRGAFQDLVHDWTGVDIASSTQKYIKKEFVVASADKLPFNSESFDAIWSITALEHVSNPEAALEEIVRVLKPGGVAYLAPAWHVRSWAGEGYEVRPWSDFKWKGKLVKVSIPFRNVFWVRALFTLPFRLLREFLFLFQKNIPTKFNYKKLKPNYEKYWCADSDACCSMDPHEMLLWFKSREWITPSHPSLLKRFLVRHDAIIVQKPKHLDGLTENKFKLALLASHPIQYQTPFYKLLSEEQKINLKVFFFSNKGLQEYKDEGFGQEFKWDIPLLDGYEHEFLPNISPISNSSGFWELINPDIVKKLKKDSFDAVWIHGWNRFTDCLAMLIAFSRGIPVLLRGESNLLPKIPQWKSFIKRLILTCLFKRVSAFLAIGKYNSDFYEHYGVSKEKIFLIPYTVNNIFFILKADTLISKKNTLREKYGIPLDLSIILFSGKLIDVKRPLDLLKAYEIVSKNYKVGLAYVGDGRLRNELEDYCDKNHVENVYFMGFRNQTELPEFYSMADVFVLPSSFEPWGLVVNEAMCFSLPIIISDQVGAGGDLVKEGVNGFIFPVRDIFALSEKLKVILADKNLAQKMGRASKEIIAKWSYKEGVQSTLEAMKTITK